MTWINTTIVLIGHQIIRSINGAFEFNIRPVKLSKFNDSSSPTDVYDSMSLITIASYWSSISTIQEHAQIMCNHLRSNSPLTPYLK